MPAPPSRRPLHHRFMRRLIAGLIWLILRYAVKLTVTGQEHVPDRGPYLVIANHYSWFEVPLLYFYLPQPPVFFAARELQSHWLMRRLFQWFDVIPVYRGQVDRAALRAALQVLREGRTLAIFPEGIVDPDHLERVRHGETNEDAPAFNSRPGPRLIPGQPGAAYIAVQSKAPILPVAFLGTESIFGNLRYIRRTPVQMHIGPLFGPLSLPPGVRGRQRTRLLQELADEMMRHIAALLPPEQRGPYRLAK